MRYRRAAALLRALALICIVLAPIGTAAQGEPPAIVLGAQPFFEGAFRPGSWLPVRLTVANSGPDVRAKVSVEAGSVYETEVELPRGANKELVLYVLPSGGFRRTAVARVAVDGKEAARVEIRLAAMPPNTRVTGVLAAQPPSLPLPRSRPQVPETTLLLKPGDLASRREGLAALDVLILEAPPAELSAEQAQAIADWVRTGGQLVVGGSRLAETLAQLPPELQIAAPGEPAPRAPISLLPELGDAVPQSLALIPHDQARTAATAGAATVAVQRPLGRGSVTLLGWSLSAPELAQLPPEPALWNRLLNPLQEAQFSTGNMPRFEDQQLQQLSMALTTLPVLANPPLGVLIGLLAAYILVIGPGLYFVLRRFDRQAWGWVAIPVITVLFALGMYGYGLSIRGNDIVLNQVSIVEPLGERSRVRVLGGLFSPRSDTYAVHAASEALFRPLGTEFGGMPTATVGGIFEQGAGVGQLEVAQWSMNSFAAEQMVDGQPLSADISMSGNLLRGSITNTGSGMLRGVALVQGLRVAKIGDLEPGQSKPVELELSGRAPNWNSSLSMQLLGDEWNFNQPKPPPAEVRIKQSVLDALYSMQPGRDARPMVLGWLDQPPLQLEVDHGRVLPQQTTLVRLPVEVRYQAGAAIEMPRGWVVPRIAALQNNGGACMSQFGAGWFLNTGVMTSTLQLPPDLRSVVVDEATVFVQPEGPIPDDMSVEVLDATSSEWIAQGKARTAYKLEQPRRFFDDDGTLVLRLAIKNGQQGGGCIATDLSLKGTQP